MTSSAPVRPRPPRAPLAIESVSFDDLPRRLWDALLAVSPAASPFSSWTFHRAWWDAYGGSARQRYLVATAPESGESVRAILPLMERDQPGAATTLFMAATYHADYATILADPEDLERAALSLAAAILRPRVGAVGGGWQVVDLRRFRESDRAWQELARALDLLADAAGWTVRHEVEDVCPVVPLAEDWEAQLERLPRKARHEVRRKLRRAERAGPIRFVPLPLDRAAVDAFIDLHQARFGGNGLFPATEDGERSRFFLHRLAELEAGEGSARRFHLAEVRIGARVVYALAGFDDGVTCYFYNAGMDPEAMDQSPGIVGTAAYMRDRLEQGRRRFDFLRGAEAYKYQWGAIDEPIHRIVATPT